MSIILLTLISNLCTLSSVENVNGKWSSPKQVETYKLECIMKYVECYKGQSLGAGAEECVEKRLRVLKGEK